MERSSFKPGSASPAQNAPKPEDSTRKDEYGGRYVEEAAKASDEERFGGSQNPVREQGVPASGLRSVGG